MISDSLEQLLSRAKEDDELMAALRGARTQDDVITIAKERGIEVDPAELRAQAASSDVELSDADLEAAAGGWHPKYGTFTDDCI